MTKALTLLAPIALAAWLACSAAFSSRRAADGAGDSNDSTALRKAAEFLWSQQGEEGGWRSETYGLLKSGQALTPFVLQALLQVPESDCPRPIGGVERALVFLRRGANPRGALGRADPDVLEYPNYATALALRCFVQAGRAEDRERIARMRTYLEQQQLTQQRGFKPEMLAFGAWGFGGDHRPGETGHVDLSHVRYVLEALRVAESADEAFQRSEVFLRLVQKDPHDARPQPSLIPESARPAGEAIYDGGFYISPIVLAANKGQPPENTDPAHWYSYASATCDGVLALLAAGVPIEDTRLQDARAWLARHPRLDYPEGIPPVSEQYPLPWGEAIRFYHYAVRAQAYAAIDWPGDWRTTLLEQLNSLQHADGSFTNDASPLMKEDDPLVATTLAVLALQQ